MTLTQWQSLGEDCINSSLNANLLLQNDIPQSGSPLFNAGVDLGSGPDVTGTTYAHRNTIGAYEGSATYLAPQSITGLPITTSMVAGTTDILPATTTAALAVTYSLVSGPATLSGHTLTFTGTGIVEIEATQAGNSSNAPLTEYEVISVQAGPAAPGVDTPTLPPWALALLGIGLVIAAARTRRMA
jgi:hypothetical protein